MSEVTPVPVTHEGCDCSGTPGCCTDHSGTGEVLARAVSRRSVLALGAAAVGGSALGPVLSAWGLDGAHAVAVPADKGLSEEWRAALYDRGTPTVYSGAALKKIGMPVGGGCAGQVYLAGDGRLWLWDIANPQAFPFGGADWVGVHYANPLEVVSPFRSGFVLRAAGSTRTVDSDGFASVTFTGQYPIGKVELTDPGVPVKVGLEAFSPFVPGDAAASTIPVTVLEYTLTNTGGTAVDADLLGYAEHPVALTSRSQRPLALRTAALSAGAARGVHYTIEPFTENGQLRPDVLFEDWERTTYDGWTVAGQAFGAGPVTEAQTPEYFRREGPLNLTGQRFVTSHNFRAGGDGPASDTYTGKLTSRSFTIDRRYVIAGIGGGNHGGQTCLNVVVDGAVVGSITGADSETLRRRWIDVGRWTGKQAVIEIVDSHTGAWGHVNVDGITFSDVPYRPETVFEDWEKTTYDGWTVSGNAFGAGPVTEAETPAYFRREGALNVSNRRFVTSHNFRAANGDLALADTYTGKLTSAAFTIQRRYLVAAVAGGNHPGQTCLNVLVGSTVVGSITGADTEILRRSSLDLGQWIGQQARIEIVDSHTGVWGHVNVDAITFGDHPVRPEIRFEDWERTTYDGWTVSGNAFGAGPVTEAQTPDYFRREGPLNVTGQRFVTSHNFRAGGDAGAADTYTGKLTSRTFSIDRRYVVAGIGGGTHAGQTCLNIVVDGAVVGSMVGGNSETLRRKSIDVSRYEGRPAHLEIVDANTGGWGHVNVDAITFTDEPMLSGPVELMPDAGSFGLVSYDPAAVSRPSIADGSTPAALFDSPDVPAYTDGGRATLTGTVRSRVSLAPGESKTVRFALTWSFPNPAPALIGGLVRGQQNRRHYVTRFADAAATASYIGEHGNDLSAATKLWRKTWYDDSTLPHWFLERTLAPASTIATNTCFRFDDGRFYALEGLYCCDGTCTHVWNYAQSLAYLFPELERDTRERVDFNIAFNATTGAIGFRGEIPGFPEAMDGQAGNILRTYREHKMAPNADFLRRVWPRVKKAMQFMIDRDTGQNGILDGKQHNTLDTDWYGQVPWLSGLYVAALRAAEAMARELGDTAFASTCATIATAGTSRLSSTLWNPTYGYFEHLIDPAHTNTVNSNRGCHIDQLFGQMYTNQLSLPRAFEPAKTTTALTNMYRYNFLPDPAAYKETSGIEGGRVYSTSGEAGTIMTTWPFGGADTAPGAGGAAFAVGYFNEVWTGQEYQFAAGLISEGMVDQGMSVVRAVYDRHTANKRNPYNEIECSDHYARGMAAHAAYLAVTGVDYHGPRGHLGVTPRVNTGDFAAAFTGAQGWGVVRQQLTAANQELEVEVRHGTLRLSTLTVERPAPGAGRDESGWQPRVSVRRAAGSRDGQGTRVTVAGTTSAGRQVTIRFTKPVQLAAGDLLELALS